MHIGLKIKMARQIKGYTQQELADKIHKTRPLISHIEQTGKVNYHTLKAVSIALGTTPEELERYTAERLLSEPVHTAELSGELIALRNENKMQKQEILTLRELVNSQKQLIKVLQAKK